MALTILPNLHHVPRLYPDLLSSELEESRSIITSLQEKLATAEKETAAVANERDDARREASSLREKMASLRGELQAVTLCHQEIVAAIKQKTGPADAE